MSASGVRHFFVLEASEYVERLDALVSSASSAGPDAEAMLRVARAFRGASSMARLDALVELGAAVERVARALRDGQLGWDDGLRAALAETVGELRELIQRARDWGAADDARAQTRTAAILSRVPSELASSVAPGVPGASRGTETPAGALAASGGTLHLVGGTAELATALAACATRPDDAALLEDARRRTGALRGVAAVTDHPPLTELLDALDAGLRAAQVPLARGGQTTLHNASRLLRRASEDLRAGRRLTSDTEWRATTDAAASLAATTEESVVPISQLFHDDAGPHVVEAAPQPPTTPLARFRMESAGQAEHLRRLVADARQGGEQGARATSRIEAALLALRDVALSYGETELARLIAAGAESAARADQLTLDAIDALAARLLAEAASVEELCDRLTDLARGHRLAAMLGIGFGEVTGRPTPRAFTPRSLGATPVASTTPTSVTATERATPSGDALPSITEFAPTPAAGVAASPAPPPEASGPPATPPAPAAPAPAASATPSGPRRSVTPTGKELQAFLADGLAGFKRLEQEPLGRPTPVEDPIVPIESLLYDRAGALQRARELREELRRNGAPPSQEALEELFDLLELAARE